MDSSFLYTTLHSIVSLLSPISWILYIIPVIILALLVEKFWLFYAQSRYYMAIEWSLIEIRIPRIIEKGPKAMEHFFKSLHGVRNAPGDWKDKYVDGEFTRPFSLELVAISGRTRFFIRCPKKLESVVEAMLYASYSDVELYEAEDYVNQMPSTFAGIQKIGYDLAGVELALQQSAGLPLNSYEGLETKEGDSRIVDTMSVILEIFSKLKPEESIWIQIAIAPAGNEWQKEAFALAKQMKDKLISEKGLSTRTSGEEARIKAVEKKAGQPGFNSIIRYIYFTKEGQINKDLAYRGLVAYFNQFTSDSNGIKKDTSTWTRLQAHKYPFFLLNKRLDIKKERMLAAYRGRVIFAPDFVSRLFDPNASFLVPYTRKTCIFSCEELATMYHMPTSVVLTAPVMTRIESKRVSPPSNLPG